MAMGAIGCGGGFTGIGAGAPWKPPVSPKADGEACPAAIGLFIGCHGMNVVGTGKGRWLPLPLRDGPGWWTRRPALDPRAALRLLILLDGALICWLASDRVMGVLAADRGMLVPTAITMFSFPRLVPRSLAARLGGLFLANRAGVVEGSGGGCGWSAWPA